MNKPKFSFLKDVQTTMKETRDSYLIFALLLFGLVTIISLILSFLLPGLIIALVYFVIAPLLLAVISFFIVPTKTELEQKQRYFFRLVRQFFRFNSIRTLLPFRNLIYSGLLAYALGTMTLFVALLIGSNYDPALSVVMEQYYTAVMNEASVTDLNAIINNNLAVIEIYVNIFMIAFNYVFMAIFTYLLTKRFFFVYLHINLFTKTRAKVDYVKAKYYNGAFYRQHVIKNYPFYILPVFLLATVTYFLVTILGQINLINYFDTLQIILGASIIFVIVLLLFLPYIAGVNLEIFGLFMEKHAGDIFQISINDIEYAITHEELTNEEKEGLINIQNVLVKQKQLVEEEKNNPVPPK